MPGGEDKLFQWLCARGMNPPQPAVAGGMVCMTFWRVSHVDLINHQKDQSECNAPRKPAVPVLGTRRSGSQSAAPTLRCVRRAAHTYDTTMIGGAGVPRPSLRVVASF